MTAGEITATVISALALLLSVVSLSWQISKARSERPIVHVSGIAACTVKADDYPEAVWDFTIEVTNSGAQAVTVDEVCWIVHTSGGPLRVRSAVVTQHMPLRLEGRDSRYWNYEVPIRGTKWDGLTASPSVEVVQRPDKKNRSSRRIVFGDSQNLSIPSDWKQRIFNDSPKR